MQTPTPEIIDFDLDQTSPFGSFSNDPLFVGLVTIILAILGFCTCRILISPKEALCYENFQGKEQQ